MGNKEYLFEAVANDYNSPLFRNQCFIRAFLRYHELDVGLTSVGMSVVSRKNDIDYAGNTAGWFGMHEKLRKIVEKDPEFVERIIDLTNSLGEEFNEWSKENIFDADLKKKSNEELMKLIDEFYDKQSMMYCYGIILPTLDFQSFSFVEGSLRKFIEAKLSKNEANDAFDAFTWPAHNSFAQEQEEDLLRLMSRFYNEQWKNDVMRKNLSEIKREYPEFYEGLKQHTKKHCWVYYVYAGPAFNENDFLGFIKQYLEKNIPPKKILEEVQKKNELMSVKKEEYLKRLKPDKFNEFILKLAGKFVWAKPRRKDYQSKSYYHCEKLLNEIAGRLYLTLEQIRACPFDKMREYLKKGEADINYLNSIYNFHICYTDLINSKVVVLHGKEAEKFTDIYVKKKDADVDISNIKELKGSIAMKGKVRGIVKIVNTTKDMEKMKNGDVLVSKATTPAIVSAMKKASAIITDEGGLTCHAAIVSRELNTPCIVGLRFATKVFKDGDEVEVDADKGIAKKI